MKPSLFLSIAAAAFALAGCRTALAPSPPAAEATAVFAQRGVPVRVQHFRDVGPDCENLGYVSIAITSPPRNGRIELRREAEFPRFASGHPRAKCNSRRADGVGVYYIGNPNAPGGDRFTIDIYWADGARWVRDFVVQAR